MSEGEEKKQINIEMTATQKQRWQEHIDEDPNAASLAHLIRLSVEKHLADADDDHNETLREINSKLDEQTQTLRGELNDIDRQLRKVKAELRESQSQQAKLPRAIHALLPVCQSREEAKQRLPQHDGLPLDERIAWTGAVEDLAKWFNFQEPFVLEILNHLREKYDDVRELSPGVELDHDLEKGEYEKINERTDDRLRFYRVKE